MITCCLRYVIDPYKAREFEDYARRWLPLVARHGGEHHGYFLPGEGANDVALALFSFPSFAAYERYREAIRTDHDAAAAHAFARTTRCFLRYDRTFFRPTGPGPAPVRASG
jgi:hypothetical protein